MPIIIASVIRSRAICRISFSITASTIAGFMRLSPGRAHG